MKPVAVLAILLGVAGAGAQSSDCTAAVFAYAMTCSSAIAAGGDALRTAFCQPGSCKTAWDDAASKCNGGGNAAFNTLQVQVTGICTVASGPCGSAVLAYSSACSTAMAAGGDALGTAFCQPGSCKTAWDDAVSKCGGGNNTAFNRMQGSVDMACGVASGPCGTAVANYGAVCTAAMAAGGDALRTAFCQPGNCKTAWDGAVSECNGGSNSGFNSLQAQVTAVCGTVSGPCGSAVLAYGTACSAGIATGGAALRNAFCRAGSCQTAWDDAGSKCAGSNNAGFDSLQIQVTRACRIATEECTSAVAAYSTACSPAIAAGGSALRTALCEPGSCKTAWDDGVSKCSGGNNSAFASLQSQLPASCGGTSALGVRSANASTAVSVSGAAPKAIAPALSAAAAALFAALA